MFAHGITDKGAATPRVDSPEVRNGSSWTRMDLGRWTSERVRTNGKTIQEIRRPRLNSLL